MMVNRKRADWLFAPWRTSPRAQQGAVRTQKALWPLWHHLGLLPDAVKPGIHCARTHWIRGFIAFYWVRHARIVMLMVPA
jgi:hypothetical protein